MKKTRKTRIVSLFLAVITLICSITALAIPASAAYSEACFNVASVPAKGNLSKYNLPADIVPRQGETAYINLAATTDFYFDRAEFLVKTPGSNSFSKVYNYDPSGYFRWCYCPYTFNSSGTYTVRVVVTATNGAQAIGEISFNVERVAPSSSNKVTSGNVVINWNPSGTSTTRDASHTVTLNGHVITPGTIHKTYYANGTKSTGGTAYYCMYNNKLTYVAGAQCLNYAYYCQLLLFGKDSHTTKLYNTEKDDGVSAFYGVRYNRKLTADEYKQLLKHTGEGTHLRCKYKSSTSHSIFVLAVTDEGFYYTDANTSVNTYGGNNIKIGYTTWTDFANGNYSYLSYVEYYHG